MAKNNPDGLSCRFACIIYYTPIARKYHNH